jgi:glycosyltransferase involved in cell wall biosynthesis
MKLIVIIPALNEEALIAGVIRRIPAQIDGINDMETIVVDDGSKDRTVAVARECGADTISFASNLGLGVAVRTGLAEAVKRGADIVVNIDADGQHNPEDIPALIGPIMDGRADFVIASRFKDPALTPDMQRLKLWGNRVMSRLVSTLSGRRFHDVSCGFRAYSRRAAKALDLKGSFTYTHESILFFAQRGFRIVELPVSVRGARESGESRIITNIWLYAFRVLVIIMRYMRKNRPSLYYVFLSFLFLAVSMPPAVFLGSNLMPECRTGTGTIILICGAVCLTLFLYGLFAGVAKRAQKSGEESRP